MRAPGPRQVPSPGPAYGLALGQALAMSGRYTEALPDLAAAQEQHPLQIQADIWTYMALRKLGRTAEAEALRSRPWVRSLGVNPVGRVPDLAEGT